MEASDQTNADQPKQNRWLSYNFNPAEFDAARAAQASTGQDVHGEANFVMRLRPADRFSVLDAGCGAGRVAIELARRGADVIGVDLDAGMLALAQRQAPDLDWRLGDLETIDLGRTFDIIVMAGNVIIVVTPGTEAAIVANLARHLAPGGLLIAGFRADCDYFPLADFDAAAFATGLTLIERWSSWECEAWNPGAGFAVSVHQARASTDESI